MAVTNTPLINGVVYSWGSVKVNIFGQPLTGIRAINYEENQDIEGVMGQGVKAVGIGYGDVTMTGSITLLKGEVNALEELSPTGRLQDIPAFDIIVTYLEGANVKTHRLISCVFMKNARNPKTGDKFIEVELDLFIGDIKWK